MKNLIRQLVRESLREIMDEISVTGAVQGYMTPGAFKPTKKKKKKTTEDVHSGEVAGYQNPIKGNKVATNEVDWHDEESYKHSHGDTFDPSEDPSVDWSPCAVGYPGMTRGATPRWAICQNSTSKYLTKNGEWGRPMEAATFMSREEALKFAEKVFGKTGIKEEEQMEPYDAETDTFAPGPRQRPEDWKRGSGGGRKPIPQKVNKPAVQKALTAIGNMKNHEWRPLLDRARKNYELFPDDGNDPAKLNLAMALQYMDEHPELK